MYLYIYIYIFVCDFIFDYFLFTYLCGCVFDYFCICAFERGNPLMPPALPRRVEYRIAHHPRSLIKLRGKFGSTFDFNLCSRLKRCLILRKKLQNPCFSSLLKRRHNFNIWPGWQKLAAFWRPQNITSDLLESAYLQIFATEFECNRCFWL